MVSKSEFSGKSYLISGAASGVGADICRELLNHGAYVYALDFNESALKKFEKEVNLPNNLQIICTDISSEISVKTSIQSLNFPGDKLDGLVNAAAVVNAKRFADFDQSDWEKTFSTNVFGTYYLIKYLTPFLINSDSPKIVNFASMAGKIVLGSITDSFTGDASATTFTINSGRNVNDILVFVNGSLMRPTTDYTVSGTTLTFVSAPAAVPIQVRYL